MTNLELIREAAAGHADGNWTWETPPEDGGAFRVTIRSDDGRVCYGIEADPADARLIAAAPDLLRIAESLAAELAELRGGQHER